jgi:hypothetical protein
MGEKNKNKYLAGLIIISLRERKTKKIMKKKIVASIIALSIIIPAGVYAASGHFSDTGWWSSAAEWAYSKGVMAGYGDRFNGNDSVTRGQLAQVLENLDSKGMLNSKGINYDGEIAGLKNDIENVKGNLDGVQRSISPLSNDLKYQIQDIKMHDLVMLGSADAKLKEQLDAQQAEIDALKAQIAAMLQSR